MIAGNPTLVWGGLAFLMASAGTGILSWRLPRVRGSWPFLGALVCGLTFLAMRLSEVGSMRYHPGDTFNYLALAQAITEGRDPFYEKRLPFYPLLLIPGHLGLMDPVLWGQLVSVFAGAATVVLVYLLGRGLRLTPLASLLAAAFLAVNAALGGVSLRALANAPYAAMVVLSAWLYTRVQGWRSAALLGLALGATAMTRHEGFLVAGVLLVGLLGGFRPTRGQWLNLLAAGLVFFVAVLPYGISTTVRYGVPFYSLYAQDEALNVVTGSEAMRRNGEELLRLIVGVGGEAPHLQGRDLAQAVVLITGVLLVWLLGRRAPGPWPWLALGAALAGAAGLVGWYADRQLAIIELLVPLVLSVTSIGLVRFLLPFCWHRWAMALVLVMQLLVVVMIQFYGRIFLPAIPFLSLFFGVGAAMLLEGVEWRGLVQRVALTAPSIVMLATMLALTFLASAQTARRGLAGVEEERGEDIFALTTVRSLKSLEGTIAFGQDPLPARYYLQPRFLSLPGGQTVLSPEGERAWLEARRPEYVVWYSGWPQFGWLLDDGASVGYERERAFSHETSRGHWEMVLLRRVG